MTGPDPSLSAEGLRRQAAAERRDGFHDTARALEYRARQIERGELVDPVDLDSLMFVSRDGERRIVPPNDRELALARRLLADRGMWQQGIGEHTLATALAAVREGSTLPGTRSVVSTETHVAARQWPEAQPSAVRATYRRWSDELLAHGVRPVGWPASPTIEFLRWSRRLEGAPDERHAGLERVPSDEYAYDLVCVRIETEAVPA